MEKARLFVKVFGIVQGVNFRHETKELAHQLGLQGWIKNCKDKTVEIEAEGGKEKLQLLLTWSKKGPASACVKGVNEEWKEYQSEFNDFEIVR